MTRFRLIAVDFLLMTLAFLLVNQAKRGALVLPEGYGVLLGLFYLAWVVSGVMGKKFVPEAYTDFRAGVGTLVKSAVYLAFTIVFVVVMFGLQGYSRVQVFATCGALLGLELVVWGVAVRFGKRGQPVRDRGEEGPDNVVPAGRDGFSFKFALVDLGLFFVAFFAANYLKRGHFDLLPAYDRLMVMQVVMGAGAAVATRKFYVTRQRNLYFALWQWLKAGILMMAGTGVMVYGLRLFYYSRFQGFGTVVVLMALETVALGVYFSVRKHRKAEPDIESAGQVRQMLAQAVYALDFLCHRVAPKLPWIQKVYFAITKGNNRAISRAEVLGRLCFCGFDIKATQVIDNRFYFVARKVKTPSLDTSPTYGPLVALKRSGLGGRVVHTCKFRTMHPYSEYLQQYMYDLHGLQKGGKIENDFRMTTWGKVMRKLWLDELPMLYNWVKGDFGLVGVRPLSFQYLSKYDRDLQELRKRVRPGLVPPFYADLPETFEEICESERRYIQSFLAHPVKTQIRYFTQSFVNIVFKGARSK